MNRSPRTRIAGTLVLAVLALTALPAASAQAAGHLRHHALRHAGKSCRLGRCAGDTGGTPARRPTKAPREATRRGHDDAPKPPKESAPKRLDRLTAISTETPGETETARKPTAAVIAAVLATPCADTELTPTAENLPLVRGAVLCLINRERAEHALAPLITNPRLEEAAEGHCAELISEDYFAHISPSGETPVDRIRKTGYIPGPSDGYVIGENLAWGTYNLSTPAAIVSAWIASPGHLANILESQYTETGIGIVPAVPASLSDGSPGATYAQEFGVIIS